MKCNNMWPCPAGHVLRRVPGGEGVNTKALGGEAGVEELTMEVEERTISRSLV